MSFGPASFGLFATIVLLSVFASFVMGRSLAFYSSSGLLVSLPPIGVKMQSSPGIHPLLVRVVYVAANSPAQVHLNWKPVAWNALAAVLQEEIARRPPDWPVYVQGDPQLSWGDVAPAIEIIQGLKAKALLITAKTQMSPNGIESQKVLAFLPR
jgi:biopolymer transport protein ExbD